MDLTRHLPLVLPGRTLRLFGGYWVPLVSWYLVGEGLHNVLAEAAARVNQVNTVVAHSLLALAILCQLASYVAMFLTVQRGLPTIWALRGQGKRSARELLGAVGLALLPFLLVYSAWDLFQTDLNQMQYRTWEFDVHVGPPDPAQFTLAFAVAGVVAWVLVRICEGITRRTLNPVTGVLAAVFEANWMFFGVFGVLALWGNLGEWLQDTVAFATLVGWKEFVNDVVPVLPVPLDELVNLATLDLGWFDGFQNALKNGIALPLAWLAIAGACYGREMENVRTVFGQRYVAGFDTGLEQAPTAVKRWARRFPPQEFKEKYYPPLHAVRLILTAGLPAVLVFCLCYSAITLGQHLLQESMATVIGPHSPFPFWFKRAELVSAFATAVVEPLRICLLAVTFDLAMGLFSARTAGTAGTRPDAR